MARYRKIDTRMWGDSKFRELSSPSPSAKYLWIFLLTGPHTSNVPGLFRAGEMALAEELGWSVEGFRRSFGELFAKGLAKADWKARVVWIPNAIKYNPPDNPNVVRSWRTAWDEIPECALKVEAYERLKTFTQGLGEGFRKGFVEGLREGFGESGTGTRTGTEEKPSSELKGSSDQEKDSGDSQSEGNPTPKSTPPGLEESSRGNPTPKATTTPCHEARKLAALLQGEIRRNKPDYRITPGAQRKWAITADRMLRLDARSYDRIAELICWCQADEFWQSNILSMEKLREKFDALEMKARNGRGNGKPSITEVVERECAIVRARAH
jgi:hypothetical protein